MDQLPWANPLGDDQSDSVNTRRVWGMQQRGKYRDFLVFFSGRSTLDEQNGTKKTFEDSGRELNENRYNG